ncbi:MAG: DNA methylase [Clostridia bacterium]|nr:DNA methylase [Clostridia bacterium]
MAEKERIYAAIDLKSFYASVECVSRGLDPLNTNLVVADESRTEKTICLAVSPSLKAYGIPGRARLFEVIQKVREVNAVRRMNAPDRKLTEKSYFADELNASPELELSYIAAQPRMSLYMEYSTKIYNIYLKYIAPEDIHVYSVDEVFMELTPYLKTYKMSPRELVSTIVKDVYETTDITATAGIGTNLYLCKIAMDIMAKKTAPDENGVRIAELNEMSYRRQLWDHRPLTDFWRIGKGYAKKLESYGMYTMGDVARCSLGNDGEFYSENLLYRLFGVNAELLIDHAWGWEPCTIADIKAYKPTTNSLSIGQVLKCPYDFQKARLIVREMAELLVLDLVKKGLVTDQIVLTVGYDIECLSNREIRQKYTGEITADYYGRKVPKAAHGSRNLTRHMSSTKIIVNEFVELFDSIVNPDLLVRRMYVVANHVLREKDVDASPAYEQLNLFTDSEEQIKKREAEELALNKEKKLQKAIIKLESKYGKNAVLKGMNLQEGATSIERNGQIGGHKA